MKFNLSEFLLAISYAMDFVEIDLLGLPTNHGKRVAYIALRLAERLGLSKDEQYDIVSLGILHDNGVSEMLSSKSDTLDSREVLMINEALRTHCIIGERNVRDFPFFSNTSNVIKYHHEKYDGTGFFGIVGDKIPLMSQIIFLADRIELELGGLGPGNGARFEALAYVKAEEGKSFAPRVVHEFIGLITDESFWRSLSDESIIESLKREIPDIEMNLSLEQVREVTKILSKIIDSKSKFTSVHSDGLAQKVEVLADYYNYSENEKQKLIIAADLHDLGKLAISNAILDKPGKLTKEEFEKIKEHTKYTRIALEQVSGFEDLTEWASNHHEKLNGSGYPLGKSADELDFNSRLMACLDIYQALIEERPYRTPLSHESAMRIMENMVENHLIDGIIVLDIDQVFNNHIH